MKIGIVVQRCGKDVVGGSEGYAYQMARYLSEGNKVDILTTTAKDHVTWSNYYREGIEEISETSRIIRFRVDFERGEYWHELSDILFKEMHFGRFVRMRQSERQKLTAALLLRPIGLQEEWMRQLGPYSSRLLEYLSTNGKEYDLFVFMTYLYPTTYYGIDEVKDKKKIYIVPTLHDEPPAYINIFKKYSSYKFLFLTDAEKRLAERIFGNGLDSEVIGFGIEDKYNIRKASEKGNYILYAGRLEEAKGVDILYDYFKRFANEYQGIKLYSIGEGHLKEYRHKAIEYKGFVSEEEKLSLMKGALAFVHPSTFESLGIVLLEAFMMCTPALVNRKSEVLNDHIKNSNAGFSYESYEEFRDALYKMISNRDVYDSLCRNARNYFLEKYSAANYKEKLIRSLSSPP